MGGEGQPQLLLAEFRPGRLRPCLPPHGCSNAYPWSASQRLTRSRPCGLSQKATCYACRHQASTPASLATSPAVDDSHATGWSAVTYELWRSFHSRLLRYSTGRGQRRAVSPSSICEPSATALRRAVQDKTGWSTARSGLTGLATGIPSFLLFSTTTGVQVLDVGDAFANNIGVVSWAIAMLLAVGIGSQANSAGTCRVGLIAAVLLSTGR